MSQRDVAFALELVARALKDRAEVVREYHNELTPADLVDVSDDILRMVATLKAAPVRPCEPDIDVWGDHNGCVAHPLGGWDCVAQV